MLPIYFHEMMTDTKSTIMYLIAQILSYKAVLLSIVTSISCLVFIYSYYQLMSIGVFFFSAWSNSVTHLCFICTSMSDAILSDCPFAANCCTATKCNGILVGRFNLYCYTTNICLLMSWANVIKWETLLSDQLS